MKTKQEVRSITFLKTNAAALVSQVNETRSPIIITQNGEPCAIVLDTESYDEMRDALGILKLVAQGEEDVRRGRVKDQNAVFASLRSKLSVARSRHES